MLSWVILAQGLLRGCSQDVGWGWHGVADPTVEWLIPIGERKLAQDLDTQRKSLKPMDPSAALVKGQHRAQHGRSKQRGESAGELAQVVHRGQYSPQSKDEMNSV